MFYFDLLHARPELGGVVQFSTVLLRSLRERLGTRVIPVSSLPSVTVATTSMEAFAREAVLARDLAARHPQATFLFPHFHSPLTRRGPGHRVVNIVHDVQFKSLPNLYGTADLEALDAAHRQTRERADDVLFVSEASRADFIRHFGTPRRHSVIGAPVEAGAAAAPTVDAPYLLATSHNSNHPHKNLAGLLDLFARLAPAVPDLQLRMTGYGRDVVAAHLAALPAALARRVHHHGVVARDELDALYEGAFAFVSLSRFEGFNLSAAEAAAHSIPLLLSDLPAHRELFGELALFTATDTPVAAILAHIEHRRRAPLAWAHRARCTPDAVAKVVADRIDTLRPHAFVVGAEEAADIPSSAHRRLAVVTQRKASAAILLSSIAASALCAAWSTSAYADSGTIITLTNGGNGAGDGFGTGGSYGQGGSAASAGATNGGGGGGGPGPTMTTGGDGNGTGGGGGTGGRNGATINGAAAAPASATGANGGQGVAGAGPFPGGGGAGGYGLSVTTAPTNLMIANGLTYIGGTGGASGGASNSSNAAAAGGGGGGLLLIMGGTVTNAGTLTGGNGNLGNPSSTGGAGLESSATVSGTTYLATIANTGGITGGTGGAGYPAMQGEGPTNGAAGGAGVALVGGGSVANSGNGFIMGGTGGGGPTLQSSNYTGFGGTGGNGIDLYVGGTVSNTATTASIKGGDGGAGATGQTPNGGGTPAAATSGGTGGIGINLITGAMTLSTPNLGTIAGGDGGTGGGASQQNGAGGAGGDAVKIVGSSDATTIMNGATGKLLGGMGGNAGNNGLGIPGFAGTAGGTGGIGLDAGSTANLMTLSNAAGGQITGGNGGTGGNAQGSLNSPPVAAGFGGNGGAGVIFATVPTFTNAGTITGGTGGNGGVGTLAQSGNGGNGGVGAQFNAAGVMINNRGGSIIGGNGGAAGAVNEQQPGSTGNGGVGVLGSGLTIDNTNGTLTGGTSGDNLTQAYAVQLNGGTNSISYGGAINGGIVVSTGSFQPALTGSAVGTTLTVNGPMTFANGATYIVRLTPMGNDSVTLTGVNGTATLVGSAVYANAGAGTYTAGRRTILTAVNPTITTMVGNGDNMAPNVFTGVTTNLAFFATSLAYDTTHVYLDIQGNAPGTPGGIDYRTAAATYNEYEVASGLTTASNQNGNGGPILNAFNQLTVAQAQAAFNAISGEGLTAAQNSAHDQDSLFVSSIFDQTTFYGDATGNSITLTAAQPGFVALAPSDGGTRTVIAPIHELADLPNRSFVPAVALPAPRTWHAWANGYGATDTIQGNAGVGSATQTNTLYGGVVGVDYQVMPNYLLGVAVGGSNGDFSVAGRSTSGSTTGGQVGIYDLATFGAFYAATTTSAAFYGNTTTRFTGGFGGLAGETERGNFSSHEYRERAEFGRHFSAYGATLTPFAALDIADYRSNGFVEQTISGPGLLPLAVSGQSAPSVPGSIGLRYQSIMPIGNGLSLLPSLEVAYVHEFAPLRPLTAALVNLPGAAFLVDGANPAENSVQIKAGGELRIGANSTVFASFDGTFSGINQFYGGKAGVRYIW